MEQGACVREEGKDRAGAHLLTDQDLYLFNEGTHYRLHEKLGAHLCTLNGLPGVFFAVWAPNAESVSVVGDFNGWDPESHPLSPKASSGIWQGFIPGLSQGLLYKYHVVSRLHSGIAAGFVRHNAKNLAIFITSFYSWLRFRDSYPHCNITYREADSPD